MPCCCDDLYSESMTEKGFTKEILCDFQNKINNCACKDFEDADIEFFQNQKCKRIFELRDHKDEKTMSLHISPDVAKFVASDNSVCLPIKPVNFYYILSKDSNNLYIMFETEWNELKDDVKKKFYQCSFSDGNRLLLYIRNRGGSAENIFFNDKSMKYITDACKTSFRKSGLIGKFMEYDFEKINNQEIQKQKKATIEELKN